MTDCLTGPSYRYSLEGLRVEFFRRRRVRPDSQHPDRVITLASALASRLRGEILSGSLPDGSRLPSIRKAAAEFDLSKNTVVEAYDRLVLANLVAAKAGSGFVVTFRGDADNGRPKHVAEAVDIASLLSAQLAQNFEIRVGDGRPPASWTEQSEIKKHLSGTGRILPADADAYGSALGFFPLRQQIAMRLRAQQIHTKEDSLLLTFGANHALDLIIRAMLSPGDTVLVDEPGYYPLFAKLTLAQVSDGGGSALAGRPRCCRPHGKDTLRAAKAFLYAVARTQSHRRLDQPSSRPCHPQSGDGSQPRHRRRRSVCGPADHGEQPAGDPGPAQQRDIGRDLCENAVGEPALRLHRGAFPTASRHLPN